MRIQIEKFAALRQQVFFRAVGEKAEVTDAHEAIGQDVEQEAADEFVGINDEGFFSIPIFSVSIAQGDLIVFDFNDAVIGERYAVSVAPEIVQDYLWGAERFFRVNDPVLLT